VDVQAVYDEFSHGHYSAQAIRDFLTYTQIRWPAPIPEHVVLVGDSTYDPKNNLKGLNASYLPYATYNKRVPTADPADEWFVRLNGNDGLSDLIIGRISVASVTDAQSVVRKILRFEGNPLLGPWRSRAMLLSDNYFESRCEKILERTVPALFERDHLQVRNYPMFTNQRFKAQNKNKKLSVTAKRELVAQLNEGAGLMEYFGHGGGCVIADEGWFVGANRANSDVLKLDNRRRLPFVSILSCLTGLINFPTTPFNYSLSEELVRRPERGAIAVYGPSGFGGAQDHDVLTRALNLNLYDRPMTRLGDATTLTEGLYFLLKDSSSINQQFNYFGDPLTRNGIPSTNGHLECSPTAVNALQGGRLLLKGGTSAFDEGKGLLRVYHSGSRRLFESIPVQLNGGRVDAELYWPPGAPRGRIQVQGYFWNAARRQDLVISTSFLSEVPQVELSIGSIRWDSAAGAFVLPATLENKTVLPCPRVDLALASGSKVLERRTLELEPSATKSLDVHLLPPWLEKATLLKLSAKVGSSAPVDFEAPDSPQVIRFAVAPYIVGGTQERHLLTVDLSEIPEHIDLGQSRTNLPLGVSCSDWQALSQLEARLDAPGNPAKRLTLPDEAPSPGQWWRFSLPVEAVQSVTEVLSLTLRHRWVHGSTRESTWLLENPIPSGLDLALSHIEAVDPYPLQGYSVFLQAEFRNLGAPVRQPGRLKIATDRKKALGDPLSNQFNVQAPKLPGSLQRGEIVRQLFRWEAYDNEGETLLVGSIGGGSALQSDRNPANNRFEVPLHVLKYGDFSERLKSLRFSRDGLIPEKIKQAYYEGMREIEWMIAYESFYEGFAKPNPIDQLAFFALSSEEFEMTRLLVERKMAEESNNPAYQYLSATIHFRESRLEEGAAALRAALKGGFFEEFSTLSYLTRSDPRYVRASREFRNRRWQGPEILLYSILEQQPANLWALDTLGRLYRNHGMLERAAEAYQQILRLVDYDYGVLPEWWFKRMGQTYAELGQSQKALDIFGLGIKYHPQADYALWESQPRIDLGHSREVLGELLSREREGWEREEQVFAWHQIGRCYEALQRWQPAEEAYRTALQLDPVYRASRRSLLKLRTQKR